MLLLYLLLLLDIVVHEVNHLLELLILLDVGRGLGWRLVLTLIISSIPTTIRKLKHINVHHLRFSNDGQCNLPAAGLFF